MQFQKWNKIDWGFSDYSSSHYPLEMNSLHWYPASFIPQIPSIFIQELSSPGDIVFDPFMGSGTTLIEAIRQKREFAGNDINPFAYEIVIAKIKALLLFWGDNAQELINAVSLHLEKTTSKMEHDVMILPEAREWFNKDTLIQLQDIHLFIAEKEETEYYDILKFAFTGILNRCCAQRDHYTYITDGCRPSDVALGKHINAFALYVEQLKQINAAVELFRKQYKRAYGVDLSINYNRVIEGVTNRNSKSLINLGDNSVDLIVTSPPYLGMNDYVRSMRLYNLFYPNESYCDAQINEIGARWKRRKKNAYIEFASDMSAVYKEMARVLKPGKCLCLVLGESQGKVNQSHSTIQDAERMLCSLGFEKMYETQRNVSFRRIISKKTNTYENIYVYRLR